MTDRDLYLTAEHLAQIHNHANYDEYRREVQLIYEDLKKKEKEKKHEI